jgi:hypothetical protein
MASVEQKVTAELAKLNIEAAKNPAITRAMIAARMELTRAQALGITSMQSSADKARIEAAALGLDLQSATAFRLVQERIAQARRNNEPLSAASIASLKKEAAEAAGAEAALAKLKVKTDALYERKALFLTDEDAAIASKLRTLYGDDIPAALKSSLAAELRFNDQLKRSKDLVTSFSTEFTSGFINNMRQGMKLSQAFGDASAKAINSLIDQLAALAVKYVALNALAATFNLLTGGAAMAGGMGLSLTKTGGLYEQGGIVGSRGPLRAYQTGGLAGHDPNAIPIIAHKGEEILPLSDPRHRLNQGGGRQPQMPPPIVVNFEHHGNLTHEQLRQHATELARHVADLQTYNRAYRPKY